MIICPRCGTKNNDNFNCCYNCGNPLNKQTEEIVREEQEEVTEQDVITESQNDNSSEDNYGEYFEQEAQEDLSDDTPSAYSSSAYRNQQTVIHIPKKTNNAGKKPKKKNEVYISKAVAWIVIGIVIIIVVWGMIKLMDSMFDKPVTPSPTPVQPTRTLDPTQLDANIYSYADTDINGDKFFKLYIETTGSKVYIMNKEYTVENGAVSLELTEYDIYCTYRPSYIQQGEKFDAEIPVLIKKDGFADYTKMFQLKDISTPTVPMELLYPTDLSATIYKTKTTLSFKTLPGSEIYINDENYTKSNFDDATGVFSLDILTPPQDDPYRYKITIESNEFSSRTVYYELVRSTGHDPDQKTILELDKLIYEVNADNTVKVTGTFTGAQGDLRFYRANTSGTSNNTLELVSVTFNEDGNGSFVAVLKCTLLGWTEVVVECATDLGINETIYVKNLNEGIDKVTSGSWGINSNYDKLAASTDNHGGQYFVIGYGNKNEPKAKVVAVKKTEIGYALAVDIDPNRSLNSEERLVWVELLSDTCTYKVGDFLKIFATRSLSYTDKDISAETMPRFLAIKIYN